MKNSINQIQGILCVSEKRISFANKPANTEPFLCLFYFILSTLESLTSELNF